MSTLEVNKITPVDGGTTCSLLEIQEIPLQ